MQFKTLLIGFSFTLSSLASAAEINIESLMTNNVQSWLKNQITDCNKKYPRWSVFIGCPPSTQYGLCTKARFDWLKRKACVAPFEVKNPISNITIRSGSVRYAQVQNSPIPSAIKTRTFIYNNCSSTPINISSTEKITSLDGTTISTKDSVKTSVGVTAKLNIGVEIGLSASQDVSFEKQQTTTQQTSKEFTLNINKTVPPYTTLLVSQTIKELYSWFDFEGDLYLDGLVSKKEQYANIIQNNFVTVKGEIFNSESELSSLAYQEIALPQSCEVIQLGSLQKQSNKLTDVESHTSRIFTNGMAVATKNQVGNIQVRLKSLGSDYCKVDFHSSFGTYSVLARPNQMSEWENLLTYTGSVSTSISSTSNCKSGFSAEIKY